MKRFALLLAALAMALSACGDDGDHTAAGHPTPVSAPPAAAAPAAPAHNDADVMFAQMMIPHHEQALEMAKLASTRASDPTVKSLATRVQQAQDPEIETFKAWLTQWKQPLQPPAAGGHGGGHSDPTGMMSEAEMARLSSLNGRAFDREWLQMMIKHHEGAISMVDELEAAHGSRQDEFVFRLSQDVYADQTTEIEFLKKILATIK